MAKKRYAPAIVRAKIKKILSKPVWDGKPKEAGRCGGLHEEISKLKGEIKDRRDEVARLKVALRVCWKICRDGREGEEVTRIVIAALGNGGTRAPGRRKPKQGADKGQDG